jgi:para-aminobenzoate synthetase component 1
VLLRSALNPDLEGVGAAPDSSPARYSLVTAEPFLTFRSFGSRCEATHHPSGVTQVQFGNPWRLLDSWMARYELLDERDFPLPLGGCFGCWGYDLKNFVEPKLPRRAANDLELPDCHVGFYDSLVAFDQRLGKSWIISTGLVADGSRSRERVRERLEFWQQKIESAETNLTQHALPFTLHPSSAASNLSRQAFLTRVRRAQSYIRSGDIYQVNLSQRLAVDCARRGEPADELTALRSGSAAVARGDWSPGKTGAGSTANCCSGWDLFQRLNAVSPAPFSAFLDGGDFQIASSSPELFLRLSGRHVLTRPIKGTRPRSADPAQDARLTYELQSSAKEMAELVMITDLLRNDLGKISEFGSVQVPDLARLERYAQVQHLVSTVEGRLRPEVTHLAALASCFPGGSITGAPKIRAMEIIDELEPIARGPYTGALGYLGFNRESQLSILIRSAICKNNFAYFNVGAGIVADSCPEAEYEETLAKARGFLDALNVELPGALRLAAPLETAS